MIPKAHNIYAHGRVDCNIQLLIFVILAVEVMKLVVVEVVDKRIEGIEIS